MSSMFKTKRYNRDGNKLFTHYIPTTEKAKRFYIYKYTSVYNELDSYIKKKSPASFKNEIKLIYMNRHINDTYD